MKKYIIVIISFFSIFTYSNAFFWWGNELDLFNNIDTWIDELEHKMIQFEANWWTQKKWILKEINRLSKIKNEKECLDDGKNISEQDFEDIALKGDIVKLSNYISDDCKVDWVISNDTVKNYLSLFKKHYENSKKTAEEKSDKIYNISKIWLFSDWIVENSWFDLIYDIEEIDKIIFIREEDEDDEYGWEENIDLTEVINWLLSSEDWNNYLNNSNNSDNSNNTDDSNNNLNNINEFTNEFNDLNNSNNNIYKPKIINPDGTNNEGINNNSNNSSNIENKYMCSDDNSQLTEDYKNNIYLDINKIKNSNYNKEIQKNEWLDYSSKNNNQNTNSQNYNNNNYNTSNSSNNENTNPNNNISNNYVKVTDNKVWPCETFFCIDVEFMMYQHNLFWWDSSVTIEYLLNRSNEHLGNFASTSLIQSKMTTNLFEIWLKDLNLPDIFHMAIQVSTKPLPILNIEDEWKEDKSEFASKNLLEKYYKINWLDYNRRNDLVLMSNNEQDKQSIINSDELPINNSENKITEYNEYLDNMKKEKRLLKKSVEKEASYWILDTFVEQYTEIDKFTFSIYNYANNLHTLISKLRDIPIDKG